MHFYFYFFKLKQRTGTISHRSPPNRSTSPIRASRTRSACATRPAVRVRRASVPASCPARLAAPHWQPFRSVFSITICNSIRRARRTWSTGPARRATAFKNPGPRESSLFVRRREWSRDRLLWRTITARWSCISLRNWCARNRQVWI